jgi:hypothetical protein
MHARPLLQLLSLVLILQGSLQNSFAQIQSTVLTKNDIPKAVKYKGKLLDAFQYRDSLGDNIIIRSETGIFQTKADIDSCTNSADLFAYHYVVESDTVRLMWRLTDFIKACELDVTCDFLEDSILVTDLDKDSIAEVWITYQTSCRGDVSPNNMKIIMFEGEKKYAMKGLRKIRISPTEILGGKYVMDAAFLAGNPLFKNYAKALWKKYEMNIDDPL